MQLYDTLLHLSLIEGVGPTTIHRILEHMPKGMALRDLYNVYTSDFITMFGLSEKTAVSIVAGLKDTKWLHQEKELIEKHAIAIVTVLDDTYPALLKAINVPPVILYVRGALPCDTSGNLAVVGARKANFYGLDVLKRMIPELVACGTTVVSGGAIGIDTIAHEQAVHAGGQTIAVLGSGLLRLYPASNRKLFESIIQSGGALVSSFPLRMEALPGHFPVRNRIISGLSKGCLVVQAAKKSGALITAQYALDQGRELFAVPGPINSPLSVGCHDLIRNGATLVASANDITEVIGTLYTASRIYQRELFDHSEQKREATPDSSPESRIKQLCSTPRSLDDLVDLTSMPLNELHAHLFQLQLKGQLQQDFMGLWQRI